MLDWKKATDVAQTAHTLGPDELAELLEQGTLGPELSAAVSQLLTRMRAPKGFMATSTDEADVAEPELAPGARVGVWEIVGLIGTGGMGEVYRAVRADGLYDQTVALKLIQTNDTTRAARFDQERRRLALMEHPGISRIIDGGVAEDGRPFMAMEFVDGVTIDVYAERHALGRRARLRLFSELCDAVAYAHGKLILHRDIKAANVLVDGDGQVRLIDFGIASDLGEETAGGALTLAYAAPEQLMGEPLSVATDVHALGALLHTLLTGALPERQSDGGMRADLSAIGDDELGAIITCALALSPGDRYASATAFGDDVRAYLDARPVAARNGGLLYRGGRFLRRYPIGSTLAAAFVIALAAGLLTSMMYADRAREEATRATEALRLAEWQLGRSETYLKAQEAYGDVLQRSFGGEENAERLSELMMSRWQEAMDVREDDPLRAASLSYAIGRNFYFRGDVRRALEIFDVWMAERFGPDPLIETGEEVYALMLTDASRSVEAEVLLRKLIERFETGFNSGKADLFQYAFKLARITREPADLTRAETLVVDLIATDTDPFERLFHHNQLAFLRNAKGDRDGAYDAFRVTVDIFEENPNLAAFGRDIARYNLASQELAWKRDLGAAALLVEKILGEDVPLKGESVQKGRTLTIKALVEHEQGAHAAAAASAGEAVALAERFAGSGSKPHIGGLVVQAMTLAGAGDRDAALAVLETAGALTRELPADDDRVRRLALARAYVGSVLGVAPGVAVSASPAVAEGVRNDSMQFYLYQRLVELGIAPALAT